ncbi:quinon protein alcohol dehydrogenase-like superfamily [Mycena epipterygia]|nr:quinon protein alcohol dehydrogenase-like superfamily [Mycena epipterygia]
MAKMVTRDEFFKSWTHSLAEDFQQNGVPAASDSWVSEVARIGIEGSESLMAALSHDNALIAAVAGREIRVFDVATSQLLHTLQGHAGHIASLEFHPGGRKLASGSSIHSFERETMVRVWDLDHPDPLPDFDGAAKAATTAAASILLRYWSKEDLESSKLQKNIADLIRVAQTTVDVRHGRAFLGELPHFEARAFSHDGSSLLYLPDRRTAAVLDVDTLTERFRLTGHTDAIMWAETSPDDKVIATSSWDQTVRIWSMESGNAVRVLEGATNQSWSGAFSPDGELIAAGAGDRMVRIWRIDTGELLHTLGGFRDWIRSLSFSLDSLHLAAGAAGGTLRIFNAESGACEQNWQIDSSSHAFLEITEVQYTSRGDLFFRSSEGRIFGYRASKNLKWDFFETRSGNVITSAEGSKLVAALGSSIGIWKIT